MKNPLKTNVPESKAFHKVFVNRNVWLEEEIKGRFVGTISIVNEWIIPLMKQFGFNVNFESVMDFIGTDIKSLFIDALVLRDVNGTTLLPSKYEQLYKEKEKVFESGLLNVITDCNTIRWLKQENKSAGAGYERKIADCQKVLAEPSTIGNKGKKENAQMDLAKYKALWNSVSSVGEDRIKDEIKSKVEEFSRLSIETNVLKSQKGLFKLTEAGIEFEDEVIMEMCAVYAETPQEVAFIEKLKQLADLINEVYGDNFPGPRAAFYPFFKSENGHVTTHDEITKQSIEEFAKLIVIH